MSRALLPLLWRELESLFFSPLAYIVLTIFLLLNGVSFAVGLESTGGVVAQTIAWFLGEGPLFWVSLLIVPALVTMRLVAEERRSGLIEVTLTAPVRDGEVVLAKFLGAMVFQVFLWAPTLLYVAIIRNYGAVPDAGQILTSYLGILCISSLLTALGLVFSTWTTNQIVAAVATLTVSLILLAAPLVAESMQLEGLAVPLRLVSMVHHFGGSFSRGILDSASLAWYGAATAGLLVVATRSLELHKWR